MTSKIVFTVLFFSTTLTLIFFVLTSFLDNSWAISLCLFALLFVSYFVFFQATKNKNPPNELITLNNKKNSLELLQDLSHEMKTPIFSIQGYIETLLDGAMNDKSVFGKYLNNMQNASDRLIALISDLDTIHELEKDEILIYYSTFDVIELIEEIYELLHYQAKEKNVILRKPNTKQKIMVRADRNKMSQVFMNLISNAISYSDDSSVVQIYFDEKPTKWTISLSDTGIGIAKEDQKHIFNRFYRVDKSRNRKTGGSGLGLTIVKKILNAHQSDISVKSVLNEGTTFVFQLEKA
jgi:signal transduction histidine kinase